MRRRFSILIVVVVLALSAQSLRAQTPGDELPRALGAYNEAVQIRARQPEQARKLFESAAQGFLAVTQSGVSNGPLEFNLGNALLETGDVGRAILHYRRAQRFMPRDERLAQNLKEARSRCSSAVRTAPRGPLEELLYFWRDDTSTQERICAGAATYLAFWLLLGLRLRVVRRWISGSAVMCALVCAACWGSVGLDYWRDHNAPPGVITSMDVYVYKGYGTGYEKEFEQPLQPGVEFIRRETYGDWWKIELPKRGTGWIPASAAELVPQIAPESMAK